MSEGKKVYIWVLPIAGLIVILAVMPVLVSCCCPPKRPCWLTRCIFPADRHDGFGGTASDFELGDLERERQRDRGRLVKPMIYKPKRGRGRGLGRDRGTARGDESDLFINPWLNRSLDSVSIPESAGTRGSGGRGGLLPRGLAAEYYNYAEPRGSLDLPDPDRFNIPAEEEEDEEDGSPFADGALSPFADPTAPGPPPPVFRAVASVGARLRQWKADALDADRSQEDSGENPITTGPASPAGGPNPAGPSAAAGPAKEVMAAPKPYYDPLPLWLITPKASAGPRATRFFEVDVDGEAPAAPVGTAGPPKIVKGKTWNATWDAGEEPSQAVVAQHSF